MFGSSIIQAVLANRRKLCKSLCFQGLNINKITEVNQGNLKGCDILNLLEQFKTEEEKEEYKLNILKGKLKADR